MLARWIVAVGAYSAAVMLCLVIVAHANDVTIIAQWPEILFSGRIHFVSIGLEWPVINWG